MKKIVSAVAIAAMAAGFAAAEVKISASYRTGIEALKHTKGSKTELLNNVTSNRTTSDALSFKGSADFGGMELEINPLIDNNGNYDANTQNIVKKYNGWINFGKFMIKSGSWDSRAVGRVNDDIGNHEGKFWGELNKPGLVLGTLGKDISQQNGAGDKLTTMVQYKDGALEVRGAYIENAAESYSGTSDAKDDWNFMGDVWMAEVGYTIADFGRVMATVKTAKDDIAAALFVEPNKVVDGLKSLAGFIYESKGDDSYMGVDLRARYAFDEKLSATAMLEYTQGDVSKKTQKAAFAMANVTYKMNETIQPFCSVLFNTGSSCASAVNVGEDVKDQYSLRVFPGVSIYNTSAANIITGVALDLPDFTTDDDIAYTVRIPVLMRVKF